MIIGPNDDPSRSTSFSYSTCDKLRRLAIRAAEIWARTRLLVLDSE
jgi:hypothetical protein